MGDGVDDVGTRGVLQGLTLHNGRGTVRDVRQHFHQQGIVKHRGVEQLALHGVSQVLVTLHAPRILLIETLESIVVGGEHSLRARLRQRLGVAQVINQAQIVGKRTCQHVPLRTCQILWTLHGIVDAASEPGRIVVRVVQVVVIRACRESSTNHSNGKPP